MAEALMERKERGALVAALEALGPLAMRAPGMGGLVDADGFERLLGAVDGEDVRFLVEGLGVSSGEQFDSLRAHVVQAADALDSFLASPEGRRAVLTWVRERRAAQLVKSCGAALVEQWLEGVSSDDELAATACALGSQAALSLREAASSEGTVSDVGQATSLGDADTGQWREVLAGRAAALASILPLGSHWARVLARYGAGLHVTVRQAEECAAMERLLKALDMLEGRERSDMGGGDGNDFTSE